VFPFGAAKQVLRIGESGHPAAVNQHGIPADVIDMQVRAQHDVNAFALKTGRREVFKERTLQHIPSRVAAARLVVADTGVDDNALVLRLDDEGLDATDQLAVRRGEVWLQPSLLEDLLGAEVAVAELRLSFHLLFDDAGDRDISDLPGFSVH
jgi:hypothetical protein